MSKLFDQIEMHLIGRLRLVIIKRPQSFGCSATANARGNVNGKLSYLFHHTPGQGAPLEYSEEENPQKAKAVFRGSNYTTSNRPAHDQRVSSVFPEPDAYRFIVLSLLGACLPALSTLRRNLH